MFFVTCHFGGLLAFAPRPVWAAWLAVKGSKLLALFAGHALCDFPWQGQFLSDAKNLRSPISGVPWQLALFAHVSIHAGMVLWLTGSLWMALAELVIHALTDYTKSLDRISFTMDQAIHYACKVLWAVL